MLMKTSWLPQYQLSILDRTVKKEESETDIPLKNSLCEYNRVKYELVK